VRALPPGEVLVVPAGWWAPGAKSSLGAAKSSLGAAKSSLGAAKSSLGAAKTLVLLVLRRTRDAAGDAFDVAVCNTGDGLSQHPSRVDPATAATERCLALRLDAVPASRLTDSAFWCLLCRLQVPA
jgi:hypothetical protein